MIVGTSTNCSAVCSAKRTRLREWWGGRRDLGHFDSLLGHVSIELSAYLHQLVRHLRHRNIERRHDERVDGNLLHGAPLYPVLRPDLVKTVRPRAPEFFIVQREELGIPGHTRRLAP